MRGDYAFYRTRRIRFKSCPVFVAAAAVNDDDHDDTLTLLYA